MAKCEVRGQTCSPSRHCDDITINPEGKALLVHDVTSRLLQVAAIVHGHYFLSTGGMQLSLPPQLPPAAFWGVKMHPLGSNQGGSSAAAPPTHPTSCESLILLCSLHPRRALIHISFLFMCKYNYFLHIYIYTHILHTYSTYPVHFTHAHIHNNKICICIPSLNVCCVSM